MWPVLDARADITSPSAERDLLMNCDSFNLSPSTSIFPTRSLPAKTTIHRWLLVFFPSIKFSPFTVTRNKLQTNNVVVISTTTSINQYISWIVWIHRSKKLFSCYYMWYTIKYILRKNKPRKESRVHFYQWERLLKLISSGWSNRPGPTSRIE